MNGTTKMLSSGVANASGYPEFVSTRLHRRVVRFKCDDDGKRAGLISAGPKRPDEKQIWRIAHVRDSRVRDEQVLGKFFE